MALVAGPGVGGTVSSAGGLPAELSLVIENHVRYIQGLDTVRQCECVCVSRY